MKLAAVAHIPKQILFCILKCTLVSEVQMDNKNVAGKAVNDFDDISL